VKVKSEETFAGGAILFSDANSKHFLGVEKMHKIKGFILINDQFRTLFTSQEDKITFVQRSSGNTLGIGIWGAGVD
jgi:hypothetical protein